MLVGVAMAILIDTGKIGVVINWIRTFCPEQEARIVNIVEEGGPDREVMERISALLDAAIQKQKVKARQQPRQAAA